MRFKQFLEDTASGNGDFSYVSMRPEAVIDWIEKNCSEYLKNAVYNPIFRGANMPLATIKNSNDFHRRSANTYNFYTLFMDAHPFWQKFPKRSRSFICSTSYGTADGFGKVSQVFPHDDCLIGICPASDLWSAFSDEDLSSVNSLVAQGIMELTDIHEPGRIDDIGELRDAFEQVTPEGISKWLKEKGPDSGNYITRAMAQLLDTLKRYDATDAYDMFMKLITPDDFKVKKAAEFRAPEDSEVWVQGKCAFINLDDLGFGVDDDEEKVIMDFVKRHHLNRGGHW